MVRNLVDSIEEFLKLISNVDLTGEKFTLEINNIEHNFQSIPGGVTQQEYVLTPYFLDEETEFHISKM